MVLAEDGERTLGGIETTDRELAVMDDEGSAAEVEANDVADKSSAGNGLVDGMMDDDDEQQDNDDDEIDVAGVRLDSEDVAAMLERIVEVAREVVEAVAVAESDEDDDGVAKMPGVMVASVVDGNDVVVDDETAVNTGTGGALRGAKPKCSRARASSSTIGIAQLSLSRRQAAMMICSRELLAICEDETLVLSSGCVKPHFTP